MKADYEIEEFVAYVLDLYKRHGRHDLPWRGEFHPYHVFLSEMMLQQTQVPRVLEKFKLFTERFPSIRPLAEAPQAEILRLWKGLGYNRRALFLHRSARIIVEQHNGRIPDSEGELAALPGIGLATARAILAYAFNRPVCYIETNIRAVLLHHFFKDQTEVPDEELVPVLESCLEGVSPRIWYSALMDYGSWLKRAIGNPNRRSKSYTVQSRFEGSDRQLRGRILELLLEQPMEYASIVERLDGEEHRLERVLKGLSKEGFVTGERGIYSIK